MSAKPEKTDKIDNIVGMLMEYERMTIDLMKKASDTPILDQYDLRPPYSKARLIKEEGQVKYQIIEVPLSDDEKAKLREIGELLVEELDRFILKLSYMTGRAISIAQPVLDATLPDGSRVQMTYEKEVTRRGSTFTIRKFRERPLTVSDLIIYNTLSAEMAAWYWYIIEKQASCILVGGTASGKTTTINTLAMFIKPNAKIVSIEDTAEIQLPHENWLSSVVRIGFGTTGDVSEITLFDLLKNAMRQRPEYIIVGEVRGSEAYTLMQAIATGHGGLATLHADSAEAAIHRLESEPMNIPRPLIPTIDVIGVQTRVQIGDKSVRRMVNVAEVVGLDPTTKDVLTNDVFKWNPKNDTYVFYGRSYVLENIMKRHGYKHEEVMEELNNRRMVIEWMVRNNVRDFKDVVEIIRTYYLNPQQLLDRVKREKMEPTAQGAPTKQ